MRRKTRVLRRVGGAKIAAMKPTAVKSTVETNHADALPVAGKQKPGSGGDLLEHRADAAIEMHGRDAEGRHHAKDQMS